MLNRPVLVNLPVWGLLILLVGVVFAGQALAGGGPENVLLVVNASSQNSMRVANHYARLRDLPATNVLHLDYRGGLEQASGAVFREKILTPIVEAINQRGLALQIDMIAYSCDFPWRVVLSGDYPEETKLPRQLKPTASLTGATYLYQHALIKSPSIVAADSNWYFPKSQARNRSKCLRLGEIKTKGFRSRYRWLSSGELSQDPKQGQRYLLASMLGVTTGRGNTVDEVIESLKRATYAEASPPNGVFYFMRNGDVRSATRHACYAEAVAALREAGATAEVKEGVVPKGAKRVSGLTMGRDRLGLDRAGMTILPGAFCEHLTSAGGLLFRNGYQTPLTDLIRAGATASCGAVEEPFAIQAKFPLPSLQVHYRRGCSMAEAYYQSVSSPYQLLLVGDPLCQPWAERPLLEIESWPESDQELAPVVSAEGNHPGQPDGEAGAEDAVVLEIRPVVIPSGEQAVEAAKEATWELFIDGRLRMRQPSGTQVAFRQSQVGPGWHELRCVGMNPDSIESQTRKKTWIEAPYTISAPGPEEGAEALAGSGEVTIECEQIVAALDGELFLNIEAPGADRVLVYQHARQVGQLAGPRGEVKVAAERLGRGPIRLQAVALPSKSWSRPIWVAVR